MTLVWRPGFMFDADASTYIEAVEAADEFASPGIGALETNTRYAINNFVIGCKNDGIWSAIKASCILAGARTLNGALVPLVGTAPTPYFFVEGDYNRKTGLVGDGSTKYLDSSYAYPVSLQDNCHSSAWFSTTGGGLPVAGYGDAGANGSFLSAGVVRLYQASSSTFSPSDTTTAGFRGSSRSSSASFIYRRANANETANIPSLAVTHQSLGMFARRRNTGAYDFYSDARLAFYSIGESLDLAALDGRVTDLINAFAAAIP